MNETLFSVNFFHHTLEFTPWKLIGWTGAFMFGGRWFVQAVISFFAKRPVLPLIFWYMSFVGSTCALSYFVWGKNDSVGIIMNAFPCAFTLYNIFLHFSHQKKREEGGKA